MVLFPLEGKKNPPHFFRNLLFNGLGRGGERKNQKDRKNPRKTVDEKGKKKKLQGAMISCI